MLWVTLQLLIISYIVRLAKWIIDSSCLIEGYFCHSRSTHLNHEEDDDSIYESTDHHLEPDNNNNNNNNNHVHNREEILTIRRWVLIVLILCLLFTISLLLGITLQHYQLLSRLGPQENNSQHQGEEDKEFQESATNNQTTYRRPGIMHIFPRHPINWQF